MDALQSEQQNHWHWMEGHVSLVGFFKDTY